MESDRGSGEWRRHRSDLFFHKHIKCLHAFLNVLAAAVAAIGKSDNRIAKFLAVDSGVQEGKEIIKVGAY